MLFVYIVGLPILHLGRKKDGSGVLVHMRFLKSLLQPYTAQYAMASRLIMKQQNVFLVLKQYCFAVLAGLTGTQKHVYVYR
jgi:hypothetical protein